MVPHSRFTDEPIEVQQTQSPRDCSELIVELKRGLNSADPKIRLVAAGQILRLLELRRLQARMEGAG